MKSSKYTFATLASVLCFLAMFSACGDSSTSSKETEDDKVAVQSIDDLPNCTSKHDGDTVYVEGEKVTYTCKNGSWKEIPDDIPSYDTEDDLPNCTSKREGEQAYVEDENKTLVCEDGEWVDVDEASSDEPENGKSSSSVEEDDESSSGTAPESAASTLKDSRDGQVYKITKIGKQVWMAQNLNYKGGTWYCPSGSRTEDASCEKYGKLYSSRSLENLCPDGWVVPNADDWNELIEYVDANNGKEGVGKSLKASKGWYEEGYELVDEYTSRIRTAVASGRDKFGFSALPAGSCWSTGCYTGDEARFMTASGYAMKLSFDNDEIVLDEDVYMSGAYVSLRCIKDVELGSCGKDNEGEIKEGHKGYICDDGEWRLATNLELDIATLGTCMESLEGGTKTGKHGTYVCMGGAWHDPSEPAIALGTCDNDNDGSTEYNRYDSYTYICDGGEWRLPKDYNEQEFGLCNERYQGRVKRGYGDYGYEYRVCNDGEWESATLDDYLGTCNAENEGAVSEDLSYICRDGEWVSGYSYNDAKGSLWNMDVPAFQVQTPEVVACMSNVIDMDQMNGCFQATGGWWFAYDATQSFSGTTANVTPSTKNADGTWRLITVDENDGSIIPNGNLVEGMGLFVTMSTTGVDVQNPGEVGIGFNWTKSETPIDISAHGGFCISYTISGDPIQMVLGWEDRTYGYDEYYYELRSGSRVLDISWNMFQNEGWGQQSGYSGTLETARERSIGLRFRIFNSTSTEMRSTFVIHSLGWLGECGSSSSSSTSGGY